MANYNKGRFIKEAIESLLAQTYKNWELVIVDDASTDNSVAVIKLFLPDKRIKLIRNKINLGCGGAKKKCADNAAGEILGILDADDILAKNVLAIVNQTYQENPDCEVVYTTHYECDEQLVVKRLNPWIGELKAGETNLKQPRVSQFLTFTQRAYIRAGGFNPLLRTAEDKDLIYKLEEVAKFKFINQPLYYYRMYKGGIASLGRASQKARLFEYLAKYYAYCRRSGTNKPNYTQAEIINLMLSGLVRALFFLDIKKAFFFLGKAINLKFNFAGCGKD